MKILTEDLKLILNHFNESAYIVDKNRKIIHWNTSAENTTGYSNLNLTGNYCYENTLNHIDNNGTQLCKNSCPLVAAMKDGKIKKDSVFFHHKDGHCIPTSIKILPYRDENNQIIGAINIFNGHDKNKDISKKIKNLERLAMLDELTQIPNRRYIENIIKIKLDEYLINKIKFGFLFIDIDDFKKVNDNYGHDIGDIVLKNISKTFLNNSKKEDIIGRWGGEEFIAIFPKIDENLLYQKAEKLRMLVENTLIKANNKDLNTTISIGATLISPKDSLNTLMKRADKFLYKSKQNGKNCITIG